MPISGLVITLQQNESGQSALARIQSTPTFEIGKRDGARLAAVLETKTPKQDKHCWNWLNQLPGVLFVDVVFIHFDEENDADTKPNCLTHKILNKLDSSELHSPSIQTNHILASKD